MNLEGKKLEIFEKYEKRMKMKKKIERDSKITNS